MNTSQRVWINFPGVLAVTVAATVMMSASAQDLSGQQILKEGTKPAAAQEKLTCQRPVYPAEARQKQQEGTTIIEYVMAANGFIVQGTVLKSSGHPLLDQAALVAVVSCRGIADDSVPEPALIRSKVAYRWRLNE